MKNKILKSLLIAIGLLATSLTTQMWAADYILGPDGSWTQNAAHTMGSSGITNWVYKNLTPSGQWTNFKVLNSGTWYGKNSGGNNVTVGSEYTPTTTGDNMYCDFTSNYSNMSYYFFFNTSTHKLIIQPDYYLAGTCGASNQSWGQTQNKTTYDATNGYFKWNTCSLTAGTEYSFKLCGYNSWTYQRGDASNVTITQGTKTSSGSGDIKFQSTYAGTAVITFVPTSNDMVIHCPYQISYNKGANGSGTVASGSKTWNASFTLSSSTFTRAGYTQDGWSTSDGGEKVYDLGGSYTTNADLTLYPHWTENMSSVTLTASPSGKGSFTIGGSAATSTSVGVTTTKSVTAVPISGYHFVSWAITGGATISSTTTNPTTVTGGGAGTAATLTATFAADDVYTLTVAAGTGISAVTGTTNNIKAGDNIAITATVAPGYTWSTWTKTGAGTLSTFTAGTKNQTVTVGTAGDITLTASATENMSTLTTSNHYDAGDPSYSAPTISGSATNVGYVTTREITAPAAGTGYNFVGWTLTNCTRTDGGGATANPITIRSNGDGAAATVVANYEEVLTTSYVIVGGSAIAGTPTWSNTISFSKKSGEAASNVAYAEIPISDVIAEGTKGNYEFKIKDGDTWYGLNGNGNVWDYYSNSGEQTLVTGDNIRLNANVVGTYIAKIDYTSDPKITITWPVALSIYRSDPNDDTNVGDHAWSTMPTSTSYRWTLNLEANTTYEFKINDKGTYYGSNTDITTSISNRDFATNTNDTKLITKSAGTFTFTWDASTHKLTVQYPKSAAISASPASVYDEGTTALTGYASELGSGSHTITYEFFKGTTLTDANKIATKSKTESETYQEVTQDNVTVDFDGNATSQVYTIRIKEGSDVLATNTVTVYRKWDIYVHDVASWGGMYIHMWGNGETTWPGNECSLYNSSTSWYTVTLDAKYPHFQLNCNNCTDTKRTYGGDDAYTPNISTFSPGSYWYTEFHDHGGDGHDYYTLHSITLTDPTVTLSASIANCKDITLTGTVTDCGNDGSFASDMKEVYFEVGGTKNAATTVSITDGTFTKTLSNATAGATNTLQAFATNIHGTGSSSTLHYTNVTLDRQNGTTGTTAVTAVDGMAMPAGASAPGRTGYTFGGYYASTSGGGKQYYNASMGSANNWDQTSQAKTIYAKWTANTWYVRFNKNGGTGTMSNESFTYDASAKALTTNTFTKPGYNFSGWATTQERANAGTVDYTDGQTVRNLTSTANGIVDLFAIWTAKTTSITLHQDGAKTSGSTTSRTGTYDSAMPAITGSGSLPIAPDGYAFMGYYDDVDGEGIQYYNADGTSAHIWDKVDATADLYAYFKKAEITGISISPSAVVAPETAVTVTATLSPTPAGSTIVCWKLLHSNGNALDEQPTFTPITNTPASQTSVRFTANQPSASYIIEATLRPGSSCGAGTALDTKEETFQIAGDHDVAVEYKCGDLVIKATGAVTGKPLDWTETTAPDIVGYSFSKWKAGDGITIDGADENGEIATATIQFKAIYDGKLTAIYTAKRMIYFNNTLGWSSVYVYFYKNDSYWQTVSPYNGSGANPEYTWTNTPYSEEKHGQMQPVSEGSNIYYFDAEAAGVNASYDDVVFTEHNQHGYNYFYETNAVRRGDYKSSMPMFVPLSGQTADVHNKTNYYNTGYWMNYPENTGYTLYIYNWYTDAKASPTRTYQFPYGEGKTMPLKLDVEFNDTQKNQYWIMVYRNDGTYLSTNYTFKQGWNDEQSIASTENKIELFTSATGVYHFTLTYHQNGNNNDYFIDVDYPIASNDYRIIYKDNATWSHNAHGEEWYHPSDIIRQIDGAATEAKKDTVSFYISKASGANAAMKFQKASVTGEGVVTWSDVSGGSITIPSSVTESGVYNFIVSQPVGGGSISLEKAEPYTGNYYIRTDCANSKWDNYRSDPDHLITYSEYSIDHGGYSHYYTHWVKYTDTGRKNVKFCIANDYSPSISDTLAREDASLSEWTNIGNYIEAGGDLKRDANVRFMWNQSTNKVSRAYIDGAQEDGSNFLQLLSSDSKIKNSTETEILTAVTFSDNENWIYEANIKAQTNAQYRLKSTWGTSNTIEQYFKGKADGTTETLIGGSGTAWYDIRLLYDFKTNRIVASYVPASGNSDSELAINADVMFIRDHQGDIAQLTFGTNGKISAIKTAYGVLRLNKWTLNNKEREIRDGKHNVLSSPASIYERSLYFISFPFRVKLSEVFGFGTYGTHWAVQRYDGADRAARGHFQENGNFWKWMNRNTEYLEPNQGYLLAIDLDLLGESSSVWGPESKSERIELYFPSFGTMPNITNADVRQELPAHTCTINWYESGKVPGPDTGDPRTSYNRTVFDSHWNVMSVPTYVNTSSVTFDDNPTWIAKIGPKFLYTWNSDDNTITATTASTYTYHAMHAYMVQYCGEVVWSASSGSPSSIVARRTYMDKPQEVEFCLEVQQNDKMIDRTYINLSDDEEASASFKFGEDMAKEFNSRNANIYTFIDNMKVAGNTMPIDFEKTTVIPFGVDIKTAGEFTFSMPDGTEGIGVTLIDNVRGTHTNLALGDYVVDLEAGTYDDRFVLEISPIMNTPTDIEGVDSHNDDIRKVMVDGILYIVKDGKVFDARGSRVK